MGRMLDDFGWHKSDWRVVKENKMPNLGLGAKVWNSSSRTGKCAVSGKSIYEKNHRKSNEILDAYFLQRHIWILPQTDSLLHVQIDQSSNAGVQLNNWRSCNRGWCERNGRKLEATARRDIEIVWQFTPHPALPQKLERISAVHRWPLEKMWFEQSY